MTVFLIAYKSADNQRSKFTIKRYDEKRIFSKLIDKQACEANIYTGQAAIWMK